jgi:hypothetical protein
LTIDRAVARASTTQWAKIGPGTLPGVDVSTARSIAGQTTSTSVAITATVMTSLPTTHQCRASPHLVVNDRATPVAAAVSPRGTDSHSVEPMTSE